MMGIRYSKLLDGVLLAHPNLSFAGFVKSRRLGKTTEEHADEVKRDREATRTPWAVDQFGRSVEWLKRQPRTKNINRHAGCSYSLKEEVESESGYVSNGMFIAAALYCGYSVEQIDGSWNGWLNISQLRASNPNLHFLVPHPEAVRLLKELGQPIWR
jgi:hypothetical protein